VPAETARLLALAFDPEVRTADDALSTRILDAALALAAASGLRHLTMDDVARRAGVGRMTVYRRFGSKSALVDALAVRECRRCLARIAAAIPGQSDAEERMAALFAATLQVIREHPLLARLAAVEPEALLLELTRDGSAVFRMVRDFLIGLVREGQDAGELVDADPVVLAELGLRLGASFVLMPDSVLPLEDPAALRRLIGAIIGRRAVA
jgi:TetR/AcrR family transcriptional regulator, repressor for uid operon